MVATDEGAYVKWMAGSLPCPFDWLTRYISSSIHIYCQHVLCYITDMCVLFVMKNIVNLEKKWHECLICRKIIKRVLHKKISFVAANRQEHVRAYTTNYIHPNHVHADLECDDRLVTVLVLHFIENLSALRALIFREFSAAWFLSRPPTKAYQQTTSWRLSELDSVSAPYAPLYSASLTRRDF